MFWLGYSVSGLTLLESSSAEEHGNLSAGWVRGRGDGECGGSAGQQREGRRELHLEMSDCDVGGCLDLQ